MTRIASSVNSRAISIEQRRRRRNIKETVDISGGVQNSKVEVETHYNGFIHHKNCQQRSQTPTVFELCR
jgi:hypothetical protein